MSQPVVIETVPGTSALDITREFEAPVDALFRAHAEPEAFRRWIGPRELQTTISRWDFGTGGGYAFEQKDADGEVSAFRGVFHTIVPNELVIQTFEYLGAPDQVSLDTVRFESLGAARSRLSNRSVFPSREALDSMLASGMEHGVDEGYQKLDDVLRDDLLRDAADGRRAQ
jgi:uncharacterized protein YndB with AHSA1/START domain